MALEKKFPSISIALATCNGTKFLAEQLNSLKMQRLLPFELVVCDDLSTDHTIETIQSFAKDAPFPVRLEKNRVRLGYRNNFMKAASLCRGDFIAFCDQDDIWERDKLAKIAPHLTDADVMLVAHQARLIDSHGTQGESFNTAEGLDQNDIFSAGPWPLIYGFSQIFRSTIMQYADMWETSVSHFAAAERMGHDRWVTFVAPNLGKVVLLEDQLVLYRQHKDNLFGAAKSEPIHADGKRTTTPARSCNQVSQMACALENRRAALEELALRGVSVSSINRKRFHALSETAKLRSIVYSSTSKATKLGVFCQLILRKSYRRLDPWKVPRRCLLDDLRAALEIDTVTA